MYKKQMGCYLSTSCFGGTTVEDAILRCHAYTPFCVEISAPHVYQSVDALEIILRNFVEDGFSLTLHNYFPAPAHPFVLNIATSDSLLRSQAVKLVDSALRLSIAAGSPLYGIHAGYLANATAQNDGMFSFDDNALSYNDALSRAITFVTEVASNFEKAGVRFIIENLFPSQHAKHSLFCSFDEITEFMNAVPSSVGLLLDLGHLNISSNIMGFDKMLFLDKFLESYHNRLFQVHLSDNQGLVDEHLSVQSGNWQLEALKKIQLNSGLSSRSEPIVYCLEARNSELNDIRSSIDTINEILL